MHIYRINELLIEMILSNAFLGKTTTVILDSNKNDAGNENRNRLGKSTFSNLNFLII